MTVIDNETPVAIAQDITVQLDVAMLLLLLIKSIMDQTMLVELQVQLIMILSTVLMLGDPVVLTVTDNNGNVSTANAAVTVEDSIAPTVLVQTLQSSLMLSVTLQLLQINWTMVYLIIVV